MAPAPRKIEKHNSALGQFLDKFKQTSEVLAFRLFHLLCSQWLANLVFIPLDIFFKGLLSHPTLASSDREILGNNEKAM
jgi:hypothetical protein